MAPVHAGMKRRHFLKALGTAAVALAAATIPAPAPTPEIGIRFHKDAFRAMWLKDIEDYRTRYIVQAAKSLSDEIDARACRIDVIYGWATVSPSRVCRVAS